MAEVTIDLGNGQTVVAAITLSPVERMGLQKADVVAILKATEVMLGKPAS